MPDLLTALGVFCGWLLIATAFGWLVGRIIKFGERDPADDLEPRRRARAEQNGIGRVDRAS